MINGIAPFAWILLGAVIVLLPGIVMLLGRGGPRDERGRRMFQFRPVRRACTTCQTSRTMMAMSRITVAALASSRLTTT